MADFRPTFPFDPNIRPVTNNLNCAVNTITRYDMEFIKAYSDKELLHALCYQIANVIDMLNLTQEQFEKLVGWVNEEIKYYTKEQLNQWLEDGTFYNMIKDMVNNLYYQFSNNIEASHVQSQIIYGVACSYLHNMWSTRSPEYKYGNTNTAIDPNVVEYNELDCSSFVILCLLGIDYYNSPYNGVPLSKGKIGFNRNYKKTVNNDTGLIRYVYEILMYATENNLLIHYNDISELQTGDIIFWCWTDEYAESQPDDWWGKNTYKYAAHTGIVISNCSDYEKKTGVIHADTSGALVHCSDLNKYKPKNQYLYQYAFRPKLPVSQFYIKGLWRFRGDIDEKQVVLSASSYSYAGGLTPTNMSPYMVNKRDGSVSTDNARWTTYFIPYSKCIVIDKLLVNDRIGYNICYYDENEKYIKYTQNSFSATDNCALIRLEFYNKVGDMTPEDKTYIATYYNIRYHEWVDTLNSFIATKNSETFYNDTIKYYKEAVNVKDLILVGKTVES